MKSRNVLTLLLGLMLFIIDSNAQNLKIDNSDYMAVYSYEGAKSENLFLIRISGNGFLDLQAGWKISVTAMPIPLPDNRFFPPEQIFLEPHSLTGNNNVSPFPALGQIGAPSSLSLSNNNEVFLVPSSLVSFENSSISNQYYNFEIRLNFGVKGGSYLQGLKQGWPTYSTLLIFRLYDNKHNILREADFTTRIFVREDLSGTPPVENNFFLQISNAARNGLLEVKSITDYINGVSVSYPNGITVSSNTPFQLKVKSMSSNFTAPSGATLPVEVVKVRLEPESSGTYEIIETPLSTTATKILSGGTTNSQTKSFKLIYSTPPNDDRLIQSEVDEDQTTLTYELTPQ